VNKRTAKDFKADVLGMAHTMLVEWVGEERAQEAAGRVMAALSASAMAARNPQDFYDCTRMSVAQVIAVAGLTGIMPGTGPAALAYAIPRRPRMGEQPQLQYQLSHRGLVALARRAGVTLVAIPVGHEDELDVELGEVVKLDIDIDNPPTTWEELRGIVVSVKEQGVRLFTGWVPLKVIAQRREGSDSYRYAERKGGWAKDRSTWHVWPVEMSMKTALHYAVSRGWAVVDDTEAVRALSMDSRADIIDTSATPVKIPTTGAAALGIVDEPAALPEPQDDPDDEINRRHEAREPVRVETVTENHEDGPPM